MTRIHAYIHTHICICIHIHMRQVIFVLLACVPIMVMCVMLSGMKLEFFCKEADPMKMKLRKGNKETIPAPELRRYAMYCFIRLVCMCVCVNVRMFVCINVRMYVYVTILAPELRRYAIYCFIRLVG